MSMFRGQSLSVFAPAIRRRQLELALLVERRQLELGQVVERRLGNRLRPRIALDKVWSVHEVTGQQWPNGKAPPLEGFGTLYRWVGGRRERWRTGWVLVGAIAIPSGGVYVWHRDDRVLYVGQTRSPQARF